MCRRLSLADFEPRFFTSMHGHIPIILPRNQDKEDETRSTDRGPGSFQALVIIGAFQDWLRGRGNVPDSGALFSLLINLDAQGKCSHGML